MFEMLPHFAGDDPSIFDRWVRWRQEKQARPWAGPLPIRYTLTLANFVRQAWSPLVISRDTLERLERGAAAVRGGKLTPLDWALFMELTFTRQEQQLEVLAIEGQPEVHSFRCYVKRRQFLTDYLGAEAMRKNPGRCTEQYLSTTEVLAAGGLSLKTELDQRVSRGVGERGRLRDVFVPNPAVMLGFEARASGVLKKRRAAAASP